MALIAEIQKRIAERSIFFSLEFSPPQVQATNANAANGNVIKSTVEEEIEKFMATLDYLRDANPLFIDVTWFLRNDPGNLLVPNSSSAIALLARHRGRFEDTMLHITCNGTSRERTQACVQQALDNGIRNILALRGDDVEPKPGEQPQPPNGNSEYFAIDLVRWTRRLGQGLPLSIAVAGHPIGHPKAASYAEHLAHLKRKVDAGSDFIITQFFFETKAFTQFQEDCRLVGIRVPILPGILLYRNAVSVIRIAKLSGITIPPPILHVLETNRKQREVVESFALHAAYAMCHELLSKGIAPGVHIYTMNQRQNTGILLRSLGLWQAVNSKECQLLDLKLLEHTNCCCPLAAWEEQETINGKMGEEAKVAATAELLVNGGGQIPVEATVKNSPTTTVKPSNWRPNGHVLLVSNQQDGHNAPPQIPTTMLTGHSNVGAGSNDHHNNGGGNWRRCAFCLATAAIFSS